MYLEYWGMQVRPFDCGHAPAFFVPLENIALCQTKLRYILSAELGAATLTGVAGVGKSELARMTLHELQQADWATAYVANPSGRSEDVMRMIAGLLGSTAEAGSPLEILVAQLVRLAEQQRKVCVVVDEVHTVKDLDILEAFRMLLNVECAGRRILNVILAGQPGMDALLEQASDFRSHTALRVHLQPIDLEETKRYVLFRLKEAGCSRGLFTRQAADCVHEFSGGLPRNINRVCELALVTGFGLQVKKIGPDIVRMAAQDLGLIPAPTEVSPAPSGSLDILASLASAPG